MRQNLSDIDKHVTVRTGLLKSHGHKSRFWAQGAENGGHLQLLSTITLTRRFNLNDLYGVESPPRVDLRSGLGHDRIGKLSGSTR
jgi:hypothetical protein